MDKATMVVSGLSTVRVTLMLVDHIRAGGAKPLGLPVFSRPYMVFLFRQITFPLLAYGFVFLGGARLAFSIIDGIYIVAGLTIALLIGAGWSAWNLVINLSRYRIRHNTAKNPTTSGTVSTSLP